MLYKKSLGQHILNDSSIADFMVSSAEVKKDDTVLEIGPGTGVVTEQLLKKAKKVIAVEFDKRMVEVLKERFRKALRGSKLVILEQDALRFINSSEYDDIMPSVYKIVASLPYNIGTAIIRNILESKSDKIPSVIVVLLQLEVVERICSLDGKGSILSNAVNYYGKPEILIKVGPHQFTPPPKVDSAVLRITNIKARDFTHTKKIFQLLKLGFSSPRRTLVNNLSTGFPRVSKERIQEFLSKHKLSPMIRAENLKLEDWEDLMSDFF